MLLDEVGGIIHRNQNTLKFHTLGMFNRLMKIIEHETHGVSCRSQKQELVSEHDDIPASESLSVWEKKAEHNQHHKYINLLPLSRQLAHSNEQILSYFLDGSRKVFRAGEISYTHSGGRRVVYPVIAGQIATGYCRRENKRLIPCTVSHEIVISLPDIADPDGKPGFFPAMALKLTDNPAIKRAGLKISSVITYSSARSTIPPEIRGTAAIQARMTECEKELTARLVKEGKLSHKNFLVKDGSLEYRHKSRTASQNYRWVIGISKTFNPEACLNFQGKADTGYIADLPPYHRTQAACFTNPEFLGDSKFAVWYIRLHDRTRTQRVFDGIIKVEKILVTRDERDYGLSSEWIDTLSAYILNERNPVCYGKDTRWANHIYPIYLTETFIKSKYINSQAFLHLF